MGLFILFLRAIDALRIYFEPPLQSHLSLDAMCIEEAFLAE